MTRATRRARPALSAARVRAGALRHPGAPGRAAHDVRRRPSLDHLVEGINQSTGTLSPTRLRCDDDRRPVHGAPARSPEPDVGAPRPSRLPLAVPHVFAPSERRTRHRLFSLEDRRLSTSSSTFRVGEHAAVGDRGDRRASARDHRAACRVSGVSAGVTGALRSSATSWPRHRGHRAATCSRSCSRSRCCAGVPEPAQLGSAARGPRISLGWSLGIITLTVHHLNVFSMMFVSVVVGSASTTGSTSCSATTRSGSGCEPSLPWRERRHAAARILLGALTAAATFYLLTSPTSVDP